jgi:hypothetical protein
MKAWWIEKYQNELPLREKMTCFTIILSPPPKKVSELLDFQHNQILREHAFVISNLDQSDYSKQCNGALSG